jgi:hypothetical protein
MTARQPAHKEPEQESQLVPVQLAPEEKKGDTSQPDEGRGPWPMALRHVRAWRDQGIMLWRSWRAWSAKPPPLPRVIASKS